MLRWVGSLAGGVIAVGLLAGCGSNPAASVRPHASNAPGADRTAPSHAIATPAAPASDAVKALLDGVRARHASMAGFTATVGVFESPETGTPARMTLKVAFQKPGVMHINVLTSTEGTMGTQVLWSGGETVKVKPSFLPFSVDLGMDNPHLASKLGWKIKETDVTSILRVLLDPASHVTALPDQPLNGRPLAVVEVHSALSPKGATREVIGLDRSTQLPVVRVIYEGDRLVYRLTIKEMSLTPPTSDDLAI